MIITIWMFRFRMNNYYITEEINRRFFLQAENLVYIPDGGGLATSNSTVEESISRSLNLVKSIP